MAFQTPEAAEDAMFDSICDMLGQKSESPFMPPAPAFDSELPAMNRIMQLHKQFIEEHGTDAFLDANQTVSPAGQKSETGESSLKFDIPEHIKPLREKIVNFMEKHVYPLETLLHDEHNGLTAEQRWDKIRAVQALAKKEDIWAIGHPVELGGKGLPFLDYVMVNEVQGRSQLGQLCLGTYVRTPREGSCSDPNLPFPVLAWPFCRSSLFKIR